jgi:RNA polymerase-binding transcription factor DksA
LRRSAISRSGTRDRRRDADALVWDLTADQMYKAFARCAVASPGEDYAGISRDLAVTRLAAARHAVDDIRAALQRMESGTYGICEQCGSVIAAERLRARPTARRCANCQV